MQKPGPEQTRPGFFRRKSGIMKKPAILISACLMGQPVRYDAAARPLSPSARARLEDRFRLVPVCPECLGGLPIPRPAAELVGGDGADALDGRACVRTRDGQDATAAFISGAEQTLQLARTHGAQLAVLKADSPSCGHGRIYDGSFGACLRAGDGVTAALLARHGIRVVGEDDL
jgi:uncharacterized protein YbbK (DUF523 family)